MEELYVKLKPDVVIHSAASYKDPNNFYGDAKTNILGAINIGYLSKKYNVSKVINFQTALCYGILKKFLFQLIKILIHLQVMVSQRHLQKII